MKFERGKRIREIKGKGFKPAIKIKETYKKLFHEGRTLQDKEQNKP
ncbi:MAG: hypothetical protein QXO40_04665 [Candidatus Aenigmatarchaeota archaeon]